MKFACLIARRFMLGGKGAGPSRLTGWVSIIGLGAGTFALIISLSVLNGFEERVTNRVIGFEGDLRILATEENVDLMALVEPLKRDQYVKDAIPYQERKGLISSNYQEQSLVTLRAIPIDQFSTFYDIEMISSTPTVKPSVYVGQVLAARLNVGAGDQVHFMSPLDQSGGLGLPQRYSGKVGGVFRAEVLDADEKVVFIPQELGKKLFARKKEVDGIAVRLHNTQESQEIKKYFRKKLSGEVLVLSWSDTHLGLFGAMRMERLGTLAVLSLIILVACFNLMSTLVLVTYQKIREIGILRTLGTTVRRIQSIIIVQGLMIGGVGAGVGIFLSGGLIFAQNQLGLFPLPEEIYFIDKLPMVFKWIDLLVVILITFILIIFSSAMASYRILQINPKEAVYLEK